MFDVGAIIDGKYKVTGLCSDAGGMGTVLFVVDAAAQTPLALKYCKLAHEDVLLRFRREVRVMQEFRGNPYVVPILDANLSHNPPYFVMPFFEHGDVERQAPLVRSDLSVAEQYFNRMIDCIEQLHSHNIFHRDIKPQNFLVGNGTLVVSDFGLCTQLDSSTIFTRNSVFGGTPGYIPPEFYNGGFRNADARGDIFMLGASFHSILCGEEAFPLGSERLPPAIGVVIERACASDKTRRYPSLAAFRQSLQLAFSVALGRTQGSGGVLGAQQAIIDRWKSTGQADSGEVCRFIDELAMRSDNEKTRICLDLPQDIFQAFAVAQLPPGELARFIQSYRAMAEFSSYGWAFAEVIADNAEILFSSPLVAEADKAEALNAAVIAADRQNRFAAMDTCKQMIMSVNTENLAQRVYELMVNHRFFFMENIDPYACRAPAIRHAIAMLKAAREEGFRAANTGNPFPF